MTQRGRAGAKTGSGARRPSGPRGESTAQGRTAEAVRIDLTAARARLRAIVEPVVVGIGHDLEELTLTRAGRRYVVRVMVDADGGINLDGVAVVSRAVSDALDEAEESGGELLNGEYQLEVSSPGVDRPLTLPRHWRRNVGRLVTVAVDGTALTGRLTGADDAGVVLDVDGTSRELTHAQLGPGRVQIEFNRVEEAELDESGLDDDDLEDDDLDDDDMDDDEDGEGEPR
jgi:ribosome maturation factor RimP